MSPASRLRARIVLIGLLSCIPVIVLGQGGAVPLGVETPLTPGSAGDQVFPSVAIRGSGGVVAWHDNATDGVGLGISGRRLDSSLNPVGDKFRVNAFPGGDQEHARVALLSSGGAVFVWQSGRAGNQTVSARFLNSDGSFATEDILVSEASQFKKTMVLTNWPMIRNNKARKLRQRFRHTVDNHHEFAINPSIAALSDDSVVVAYASHRRFVTNSWTMATDLYWDERKQILFTNTYRLQITNSLAPMQDVYFQRLSANGSKIGTEMIANAVRDHNQRSPGIAALPNGGFALCWISEQPLLASTITVDTSQGRRGGGRVDVYARIFASDGQPAGAEWRVNSTNLPCGAPSITALADGGITIAWTQRDAAPANGWDVYFRSFDSTGSPTSSAICGNTNVYGDQFNASVTTVGDRQLLIWSSMGQDGSWEGVYGRWLQGGAAVSGEFRANTTTKLRQIHPVAAGFGTRAAVVWSSYAFESGFDLLMQGYRLP